MRQCWQIFWNFFKIHFISPTWVISAFHMRGRFTPSITDDSILGKRSTRVIQAQSRTIVFLAVINKSLNTFKTEDAIPVISESNVCHLPEFFILWLLDTVCKNKHLRHCIKINKHLCHPTIIIFHLGVNFQGKTGTR